MANPLVAAQTARDTVKTYSAHPEMPFLAAGGIAIIGGAINNHGWPPNATRAIIGTVALTIVASATGGTRIAPLVHAIGLLLVVAALMAAVKANKTTTKAVK